MISLFTTPKPFVGHIDIIQRNAIMSWLQLPSECEIIICGNEKGTAEIAKEFGIIHLPEIDGNEFGTPLLSSLFERVQITSRHAVLAFVNTDIILMTDFIAMIRLIPRDTPFLTIGLRWDIDISEVLDFSDPGWESRLRKDVSARGSLHPHYGVDYYVFSKWLWRDIPKFAIGRTTYDNWLIYKARRNGARVIDSSELVTCVHQNHPRTYASMGKNTPPGESELRQGTEAKRNMELAGGRAYRFTLRDSVYRLNQAGLTRIPLTFRRLLRNFERLPVLYPNLGPLLWPSLVWRNLLHFAEFIMQTKN